jgi:hypothetical protein
LFVFFFLIFRMSLLDQPEVPLIEPTKTFSIDNEVDGLNIVVAWQSKQVGIPCDLDLNVLVFDERVCRTSFYHYLFHAFIGPFC